MKNIARDLGLLILLFIPVYLIDKFVESTWGYHWMPTLMFFLGCIYTDIKNSWKN